MSSRPIARDRGFVLLVSLGVLGVLALLAATFATLSRVERTVSNSYVDKVRAKMLAQSGVERAIATLRGRALLQAWDDPRNDWYYHEMLNAPVGELAYPPTAIEAMGGFVPTRPYGQPPTTLETAVDDAIVNGTPHGISLPDPLNRAVSGQFPGTYEDDGDLYALKILDGASMLYVNDQNPEIVRLLNNLGTIMKIDLAFQLGDEVAAAVKTRAKPWNNKMEILNEVFIAKLGEAEGRKRFRAVRDFITCHAWADFNTMHFGPKPTGASTGSAPPPSGGGSPPPSGGGSPPPSGGGTPPPSGGGGTTPPPGGGKIKTPGVKSPIVEFKADPGIPEFATSPLFNVSSDLVGTYASLPATRFLPVTSVPGSSISPIDQGGGFHQYLTGQGGGSISAKFGGSQQWVQPRAPVNVNTVTREVLVALLWGLQASFVDYNHAEGTLVVRNPSISLADAEKAADHIISGRYTFGTPAGAWAYNDWMHFKNEILDTIPGLDRFQRALINVNFNPNTDIRKLNPDLLLVDTNPVTNPVDLVRMDKSDVTVKSTELCFSAMGFYEIESLGRVYNAGRIMAEEKIETVVRLYDVLRYTTQEQFEKDRSWVNDDSSKSEGDLLAGGYPPVVSMPEYPYNNPKLSPNPYRSTTGDTTWSADYDGYLMLNGPARVTAGTFPSNFGSGPGLCRNAPSSGSTWDQVDWKNSGRFCKVSFVAGYHQGSLRPVQSHANNAAANPQKHLSPNPTNPEYSYGCPDCFGTNRNGSPVNSLTMDDDYKSAYYSPKKPYQINPSSTINRTTTNPSSLGNGFFEGGADLQPFGVYVNYLKRNRFLTYWADEVPTANFTVEFAFKPEIDQWEWYKAPKPQVQQGAYKAGPCSRTHLWGLAAATDGLNYQIQVYVQGSRIYLDLIPMGGSNILLYADHQWKAHTWHHVEFSIVAEHEKTLSDGSKVTVPHNAMLFVDGTPAAGMLGAGAIDVNDSVGRKVYNVKALKLPIPFVGAWPNNNVGTGPRMEFLSKLQHTPGYGMSQASVIGTGDNLVIHHWRTHEDTFTPRNRYHSVSYYDGTTFKSGSGYKKEKAGVYKKRLTFLENEANVKDLAVGTLMCTHYHPFHVHLYGHDGTAPTTSFGHITPALRVKTGGSYVDAYYYDGCAGLPVKMKIAAGSEIYYLGWFEVASLVPVTMSPILDDFTITYFTEPRTYYRLVSSEAK